MGKEKRKVVDLTSWLIKKDKKETRATGDKQERSLEAERSLEGERSPEAVDPETDSEENGSGGLTQAKAPGVSQPGFSSTNLNVPAPSSDVSRSERTDALSGTVEGSAQCSDVGGSEGAPACNDAMSQSSTFSDDLKPYQPRSLPVQKIYGRNFYFQNEWYKQFPWIHYDPAIQGILCFVCVAAKSRRLFPDDLKYEETFIKTGYFNWKNGAGSLKKHSISKHHEDSVAKLLDVTDSPFVRFCGASIAAKQLEARKSLRAIFTSLMYLCRQGLAIRGSEEENGNFQTLLDLRSTDVEELRNWLRRSKPYTSPLIQNEVLQIVSHALLRSILSTVKRARFYSLIVDETTDMSIKEQVSISVRAVTDNLEVEEYFLGLYETTSTTGEVLTKIILDSLQRCDLSLEYLRGQCYDGAKNMSGHFRGVQSRILSLQPKAIFVHCFNHSLNLALQDTVSQNAFFRDVLDIVNEIAVILRASPKRMGQFAAIGATIESSLECLKPRMLCPTRWTVRVKAIIAILSSYEVLLELLEGLGKSNDNVAGKAAGQQKKLGNGEYYLGLLMAKHLFTAAETFSKVLQNPRATVSGGIESATTTIVSIRCLKSDDHYEKLWGEMDEKVREYDLNDPCLPRVRQKPRRYRECERGDGQMEFATAKDRLKSTYHDALESICGEINHRFLQAGLEMYGNLEGSLLGAWRRGEFGALEDVCRFYDWDFEKLSSEIRVLQAKNITGKSISELVDEFKKLSPECKQMFPLVNEYLVHLLVVPCSSAGAERSFSRLRRIKSYLRTSMGQERLNHCCVINCYSDLIDELNLDEMLQSFVNERSREATFGNFIESASNKST